MALEMDSRRRAMLEEMGLRLWLPSAAPAAAPAPDSPEVMPSLDREAIQLAPRAAGVEGMDWPTLRSSVAACRACALCQGRKNTVLGVGPERADWLIVGEAPGEQEDLQGEPFVGPSGHLLDNMLRAIGLHRLGADGRGTQANVYIANVVKCRPPGNRNPQPQELAQCAPYLQRQIELLQPKLILAMGRFASQALLQGSVADVERTPLGKLRGTAHSYQIGSKVLPVVVTYHPAYLLRNLAAKAQAWADLCLALALMRRP